MARHRAPWRRRLGAASAALLIALLAPAPGAAHVRSGAVASDYEVTVVSPTAPVSARVYESDLAVGLTVDERHTVVVLGYDGEPFLRVGEEGVEVDARSAAAVEAGLVDEVGTGWRKLSDGRTVVWHDRRVSGPSSGAEAWSIPVVADGAPLRLEGEVRHVSRPPAWPWLLVGGIFALAVALTLVRPGRLPRSAVVLGATAAVAAIVVAVVFAARSGASAGLWVEGANELVLAVVGLVVLARGSEEARAAACALLGLLALFAGLLKLEVFTKGVVFAAVPAPLARAAVAIVISAGAAAFVVGVLAFHAAHQPAAAPGR
jgi:hypothetical protein